jgi:hypothetical protein
MFDWVARGAAESMVRAWTLGQVDDWIPKPVEPGDEHFHQGVSTFLYRWAQQHRPGVELVQVVALPGQDPHRLPGPPAPPHLIDLRRR